MTVTVRKVGGRVAVVIPAAIARKLRLTDGTALDGSMSAGGIVMRPKRRRPRRRLGAVVAGITPARYRRRRAELGDVAPVGRERW